MRTQTHACHHAHKHMLNEHTPPRIHPQSQQQWQDDIVKYNKMLREKEELVKEAYEVKKVEIEQIEHKSSEDAPHVFLITW